MDRFVAAAHNDTGRAQALICVRRTGEWHFEDSERQEGFVEKLPSPRFDSCTAHC